MRTRHQFADLLGNGRVAEDTALQQTFDRAEQTARARGSAPRPRRACELAEQMRQDRTRQLVGKEVRGDVFEIVRFVEDESSIGRQNAARRARRLGQNQRMVHHDDMRLQRPGAGAGDETFVPERTRPPRAVFGRTRQLAAQLFVAEVVKIAVLRLMEPFDQVAKGRLLVFGQRPVAALHVLAEHPQAQIVRPALEQRRAKLRRIRPQRLRRTGKIGGNELALEIARGGRQHDGRIVDETPLHGRHEIGQRFADAGPCLHHQMLAGVERARHGARHVELSRTRLIPRHRSQRAAGGKMAGDRIGVEGRAVFMRRHAALGSALGHVGQKKPPVRIVHEERRIDFFRLYCLLCQSPSIQPKTALKGKRETSRKLRGDPSARVPGGRRGKAP